MMKEIAFQPGKFQPMVEIAQRDSGLPAPAETDFAGLTEVAEATLQVATAASRGYGSVLSDPVPKPKLAKIIGYILTCRNIVEQFLAIGIHTRLTTPLRSASLSPLEPIVRAYNYYGHFELDGKMYVGRALEETLIDCLFWLKHNATASVADGTKDSVSVALTFSNIDTDYYHLSPDGEIAFGKRKNLKDYILQLVSYISTEDSFDRDKKIPVLTFLLDVSSEASLVNFLRTVKTILPTWTTPDRAITDDPPETHKAAMKKLFGSEYSTEGDTIPVSKFTGSITFAYNTLRRISIEYGYAMKTIPIPKYEGGSAAQLASYNDDVLTSSVQVSLADSTAAVAFTTSFGVAPRYKSAPLHERAELLRELISQSLLPVR
nr:hypothetical protein [Colletotrichum associated partitivirus 1]